MVAVYKKQEMQHNPSSIFLPSKYNRLPPLYFTHRNEVIPLSHVG
jgi:hypothetical protein